MEFRVLGPLEVREHDSPLPLGGPKQRSLLAFLLLHAGETVSTDRIQAALWGDTPPARAAKSIQVHVSRLRKDLGADRLITHAPGYALQVGPGEFDLARLDALVDAARGADPPDAAAALREALGLFRGEPLADLAYEPFAQPYVARLHERRIAALEARIDADLATGRHAVLVGEIEDLVRDHPLRERLRAQLMLALYRSGRQSDALDAYRAARLQLSDEVGLEPGEELKALQCAILRHDRTLDVLPPAAPRDPAPRGGRLWRRLALAGGVAGLVLIAGVALTEDRGRARGPVLATGIAAFDGASGRFASLTEEESPPSNVAVGEGAIWALSTEDRTVAKIDPRTHEVLRRFAVGGIPSDIAAGAGAIWVGLGGGASRNGTASIARVDPRTLRVTRAVRLPKGEEDAWPSGGFPGIAVGAGAVWAINPGHTISRLDPRTGRIVATVKANASTIAAGDAGVWFTGEDNRVSRLDPRTNRVGQTIHVGSEVVHGIAVGAGAVWGAGEHEGLVWRIDPGSRPVTRSIETGPGVSYLAFGDGALWAASYVDGHLFRIDPRTNRVTATAPVGAAQGIAAGSGAAWVSVAGAPRDGSLPATACGRVESGRRRPQLLIASDLLLQGPVSAGQRQMADAIRLVLRRHDYRAGRFALGYASCDTSTAQSGTFEFRRCAANANAYARADHLVAVIGPYNSQCAAVQLPILNRAPGGPIPEISPSNTYPGLTRPVSLSARFGGYRDEPRVFYPTGVRNYVRLGAGDDLAGVADALVAQRLGRRSAYLVDDGSGAHDVLVTDSFRRVAVRLGIRIAGAATFDTNARSQDAIAGQVARSGADCVVVGGDIFNGLAPVLKALRARLGPAFPILTGGWGATPFSAVRTRAGRAAEGLYIAQTDPITRRRTLGAAARAFERELGTTSPEQFVLEAAQATEVVVDAIARSNGRRASVLRAMKRTRVRQGILGTFRFDRNGDITPARVTVFRMASGAPEGTALGDIYTGAAVDRVLFIPTALAN
jgi:DNA-binding SARP family transcriptional activator/ABC-type branched-subunit amino acid transport system substrate-binding protein/DNA-binding beta-propeller fold protein YncE